MMRSLYTATTGMQAQQIQIDVTSNNIANVNTIGFKSSTAQFADLLYQTLQYAGTPTSTTTQSPTGQQIGLGVRPTAIAKTFSQGSLKETGNELDLAIAGRGMFQIQLPDGTTAYTRNGSFKLDSNGTMVTADGYPVVPQITIPADTQQVSVGTDGTVSVLQPGQTNMQQVGQLQMALFVNPAGLAALGDNNYINTAASGDPIVGTPGLEGLGTVKQGFVEMSNVSLVEQMTDLITGQRAYEANSKAILTSDEMLTIVNGLKK